MGKLKLLWIAILSIFVLFSAFIPVRAQTTTHAPGDWDSSSCKWIKLNTNFPWIWTCITYEKEGSNQTNVFQKMMWALTKLVGSVILVVCFIMIIIAWIMWAWAGEDSSQRTKAKKIIEKVAITILLIWFSGVILRAINPNFFG